MRFKSRSSRLKDVYYYFLFKDGGSTFTDSFLWLPIEINGETRWFEKCKVQWEVRHRKDVLCNNVYEWIATKFIDK